MTVKIEMEMPKSCLVCPFLKTARRTLTGYREDMICSVTCCNTNEHYKTRHPNCPLQEVKE